MFHALKLNLYIGDEQLDLSYSSSGDEPHHIPDLSSEITYFVYTARRTPRPTLQYYVRSKYEPAEYPNSLQRLYNWSPDEAIPELYTDESLFKSIHSDMEDLKLPEQVLTKY